MPKWNELQNNFSGGEIGGRMLMRSESEEHAKSVITMLNFIPTLQGTAARAPGTQFVGEVAGDFEYARILPYLTPANQRTLVLMTPRVDDVNGDIKILEDIGLSADSDGRTAVNPLVETEVTVWRNIVPNGKMSEGFYPWDMDPPGPYISSSGDTVGWQYKDNGRFSGIAFLGNAPLADKSTITATNKFIIPMDTSSVSLVADVEYVTNFTSSSANPGADMSVEIKDSTDTVIYTLDLNKLEQGQRFNQPISVVHTFLTGEEYSVTFTLTAVKEVDAYNIFSIPFVRLREIYVYAPIIQSINIEEVSGGVVYTADELRFMHFVQSPYSNSAVGSNIGKEVVTVHYNYTPKQLYWNGTAYVYGDIFTNDTTQHYEQWNWSTQGYPAACTSYGGRLVLGGSNFEQIDIGLPTGSNTETVWATEVGAWYRFTVENPAQVLPTNSISFTSIYRSPIKWLIGQKQLLIGAESMEYTASADGILNPGDIGVLMQSTHGSKSVQPVGMGQYILFPADAGRKVRALQYLEDDNGWISPDMTIMHPHLFSSGIVRMVRMHNPHQMCIVVKGDGELAILHQDTYANVFGWSRIDVGANVVDAAVLTDTSGDDVLYLLVRRKLNGAWKLVIEAIVDFVEGGSWQYMNSYVRNVYPSPTSTIDGLEHLEGQSVQVIGDGNYLGNYVVSGGEIELVNDAGMTISVLVCVVGLAAPAQLTTLPLITQDPGSMKKYTSITVRTIDSIRPVINGERAADREPVMPQDISQFKDLLYDNQVAVLGYDEAQVISITENVPYKVEILGIFGTVEGNSV